MSKNTIKFLVNTGIGFVVAFLVMWSQGVFAAEKGQSSLIPCEPAQVRNLTGAGDAMMAGLVWGWLQGLPLTESARAATAAAAICVEGIYTVHTALSPETLRARMNH